jgi:hypothetical protein
MQLHATKGSREYGVVGVTLTLLSGCVHVSRVQVWQRLVWGDALCCPHCCACGQSRVCFFWRTAGSQTGHVML